MKTSTLRFACVTGLAGLLASMPAGAQPTVTTQPTDQAASLNATAQFKVTAQSSGGLLTYRWWFKDAAFDPGLNPSAAKNTLLLSNVTEAMAGTYRAVVADDHGSTTSEVGRLTVDRAFTKIVEGAVVNDRAASWGCAWVDYDGDGFVDLFVANGYEGGASQACALYRNHRDGTFTKATRNEIGSLATDGHRWSGCSWGDFDNDGFVDLYVLGNDWAAQRSGNMLYRNDGTGSFSKETSAGPPVSQEGFAVSAPWGDYDNDGFLDIFSATGGELEGQPLFNSLFRNAGDGTFDMVTAGPVVTDQAYNTLGAAWGDYDGDGDLDLLAVDFPGPAQPALFYQNNGHGAFTRVTEGALAEASATLLHPSWADYDNDGRLDLFVACYHETSRLLRNEGNGAFSVTSIAEPGPTTRGAWGDYNNDGWLDLFVTRGQAAARSNLLFENNGDGTFTPVERGSLTTDLGQAPGGAAWGDYDNDGFLDLFVSRSSNQPNLLYRNNGNANGWLVLRLLGTASNRSAIGAKARVKSTIGGKAIWQLREISGGNGAQNDLRAHFGLGDATKADAVRIEWPSGIVQELSEVAANQFLTVTEHQQYTGAPPRLDRATPSGAGCEIAIGEPDAGARYVLETSTDLVTWTKLLGRTSTGGTQTFLDTRATNRPTRFYRVVVP